MKQAYKCGITTGVVVGIFTTGLFSVANWLNTKYSWGMQPANIRGITGLLTILIQGIGIYFSMAGTKSAQSQTLSYGQGFKAGITVALITAVLTAFFGFMYCTVINPGYADYMVNEAQKAMVAEGDTPAQIAKNLPGLRREFSTGAQVAMALIGQTVIGTVISLVIGGFVRSKKVG